MATPKTGSRGDAVVMVEYDPTGASGVYTNWCGAKEFKLMVANEIVSEKVGDCDDWDAAVKTLKTYSGQDVTASMDATWTSATHAKTSNWALQQLKLNVRVHFPNAIAGEVEYYDGLALLGGLDLGGIGNVDGAKISESVSLEFDGGVTPTAKA